MKFLVNGVEVPFVESLTLGEARTFKRISGLRLDEVETVGGDPDVLAAFVLISAQRVFPNFTEKEVDALDIADLMAGFDDDEDEAGDAPLGELVAAEPTETPRAKRAAKA